jgi:hypothetical protein
MDQKPRKRNRVHHKSQPPSGHRVPYNQRGRWLKVWDGDTEYEQFLGYFTDEELAKLVRGVDRQGESSRSNNCVLR